MSDYKVIKTNVIPRFTEVRLYDETVEHVREGHPEVPLELPCVQTAVENAISNPTHVENSHANSVVFVDAHTTNRSGDPLRVPVKGIADTTSGRVKSVYFASTSSLVDPIWRRKDG